MVKLTSLLCVQYYLILSESQKTIAISTLKRKQSIAMSYLVFTILGRKPEHFPFTLHYPTICMTPTVDVLGGSASCICFDLADSKSASFGFQGVSIDRER